MGEASSSLTGRRFEAFPVLDSRIETLSLSRELDALARAIVELSPAELVKREVPTAERLEAEPARDRAAPGPDGRACRRNSTGSATGSMACSTPTTPPWATLTPGAQVPGLSPGPAAVRDRPGPQGGGGRGADVLVRAARLDPDHRDPGALARVGTATLVARRIDADRDRPEHRPDRAARVQAALAPRAVGRPGEAGPAVVAARPPGIRPLLARPGRRRRPS